MTIPGKYCEDNELPDEIVLGKRSMSAGNKEALPMFFRLFLKDNFETKFSLEISRIRQLGCCASLSLDREG